MPFLYDITTTTGKIRREIGDVVESQGVLPGGRNFSNEEIAYFYDDADDDFWTAVSRCFDAAAAEWAAYPTEYKLGQEGETISAYEYYKERSAWARQQRTGSGRPGSITVTKADYGFEV